MEEKIGRITHFFGKIGVGVIELTDGNLSVGDTIKIKGHEEFEQTVTSMQIDRQDIATAEKGKSVGLKVDKPEKEGDEVFLVS